MKGILPLFAVFGLLLVAGCTANQPEFRNCCRYDNATNGLCVAANGTIYSGTRFCSMEELFCNVTEDGKEIQLPVCPKSELLRCNSSCVGMFCGSFEFDPKPPIGLDVNELGASRDKDPRDADSSQYGGMEGEARLGLYKGECRLLNMSPATIRASTNTNGGFALNAFRFGVGNSFADFDEANMYYPLTDLACGVNQLGSVDRYVNYAIPNIRGSGGGELCEKYVPGELEIPQYRCAFGGGITSYSYQDCAIRCMLAHYGDVGAVEPYNAYLTERNGKVTGSPFAYGGPGLGYYEKERSAIRYNWDKYYKNLGYSYTSLADDYPVGFTYYGASFETKESLSNKNGGIDAVMIEQGPPEESGKEIMDYYEGAESSIRTLEWPEVVENLMTVEKDPHLLYAYMLSHHSVYSRQFSEGHYTTAGVWKPGAEFECTLEGNECLSGYCNVLDYKRGVCFRPFSREIGVLKEAPCDCYYDYAEADTICPGRKPVEVKAFDNREKRITAAATLGAIVEDSSSGGDYVSLPSKGKVISFDPYEAAGLESRGKKVNALVIFLGGEQYPTFNEFNYKEELDDLNETLTIPQVLSTKQWAGCSKYEDCGKFYTTFVDACMPEINKNNYFNIHVCYRTSIGGMNGWNLWPAGGAFDARPGDDNSNPVCWELQEADDWETSTSSGGVDKNPDTDADVYCYARREDGRCVGWAKSALVIIGQEITYTNEEGQEVTATAFGDCILDGDTLRTKTYGYCEQCSYLTMAKEEIVQLPENEGDPGYEGAYGREGNNYCPSLMMRTIIPPKEGGLVFSYGGIFGEWKSGGVQDEHCYLPDGTQLGFQGGWPDYLPNAYYLKKKIESYLKRNVMPVIFAEYPDPGGSNEGLYSGGFHPDVNFYIAKDKSYWSQQLMKDLLEKREYSFEKNADSTESYLYSGGAFLADSVLDQGAAIIVIKRLNSSDWRRGEVRNSVLLPSGSLLEIGNDVNLMVYNAGRRVNALCPNCMVAVGIGYGDEGSGYETRMGEASHLFEYRNATSGEQLWDYEDYPLNSSCLEEGIECNSMNLERIDLLAARWELGGRNSHCEIEDEQERFAAILADEAEFGAKMLKRFGKPVVITDFSIRRNYAGFGDCWNDESAKRFMEYLGEHAEDLVKSGHIGLIYSDWTYGHSGSAGTTAIRTKEGNVEGYRGPFFEGTFLAAREFSGFQRTTSVEEVAVKERCACVPCTAADPAEICNGKFAGAGPECEWPGRKVMVKWPENCITQEACIGEENLQAYDIVCDIEIGGEQKRLVTPMAEVASNPGLYKEMIAALEEQKLPCIQNKTYREVETTTFLSHPVLFRKDGNMSYRCTPLGIGEGQFCSPLPQVEIEKMDCWLQMHSGELIIS